jgi:hypothetical protein
MEWSQVPSPSPLSLQRAARKYVPSQGNAAFDVVGTFRRTGAGQAIRNIHEGISRVGMSRSRSYWLKDRSAPFATFLAVIETYYHPEVRNDNFDELVDMARHGGGGAKIATFKEELARLVSGDREGLRPNAISAAAEYDEWESDEEFLLWLWRELYPDEPVPGHGEPERED